LEVAMALERGHLIGHFTVSTIDGTRFDYHEIWQLRNLLLVTLPNVPLSDAEQQYVSDITRHQDTFDSNETRCVVTSESIPGITAPAVILADRWGEIYLAASGATVAQLPNAGEILECVRYVAHECPECQGEAR
jgi:hypothetical protein